MSNENDNHSSDSAYRSGQEQAQHNQPLAPQGSNENWSSYQQRETGYSDQQKNSGS